MTKNKAKRYIKYWEYEKRQWLSKRQSSIIWNEQKHTWIDGGEIETVVMAQFGFVILRSLLSVRNWRIVWGQALLQLWLIWLKHASREPLAAFFSPNLQLCSPNRLFYSAYNRNQVPSERFSIFNQRTIPLNSSSAANQFLSICLLLSITMSLNCYSLIYHVYYKIYFAHPSFIHFSAFWHF